jgi:cytochrome o ubiquinol oxidase subunit 2
MPGMTTHLSLLAAQAGDYPGFSSHFSGDGFSDMRFMVHALPAGGFATWVARTRAQGGELDEGAYAQLGKAGGDADVRSYGGVNAGLFEYIVHLTAPGTAVPSKGN